MKKIVKAFLIAILTLGVVACTTPEKECEHNFVTGVCTKCQEKDPTYVPETPATPEDVKTPYTDALKLEQAYLGKSFIRDGIGEVTLGNAIDGDTATFKDGGVVLTARFNGIDTPESTYKLEPWGIAAANFTKQVLKNAYKIVLQTDQLKTNRFDSTGERYLAWVWYQKDAQSDFRLLNLEIIEQSFSASKSSGTMYADTLLDADFAVQKQNYRIWNREVKDPDYDYSDVGKYMTLKELRDNYDGYTNSHIKVVVRGIVTRKIGDFSAYIQQQEPGVWHIGDQTLNITASDENPEMPEVGTNGNWWIGETDSGIAAEDGEAGQTLYEYYQAITEDSEELSEKDWYRTLIKDEMEADLNMPYILQDGEWYGMYLYGGFSGLKNILTIGYEVRVEGNIGTYCGALQITDITSSQIDILSPVVDGKYQKFDQHVYEVEDTSVLTVDNVQMMGTLVELSNLTVIGGYNTAGSDAFTIKCQDAYGNKINIRVDTKTSIKQDVVGNKTVVPAVEGQKVEKSYYAEGALNPVGQHNINCWQFFQGKTIAKLYGIVAVYDGDYSDIEVQIMLTRTEDIILAK